MEQFILDFFNQLKIGEEQKFENLQIFPLFSKKENSVEYFVLKEVIKNGLLIITEINEGGSVPELKAINKSDKPVLMLEGEELKGAKQNRILNISILVPPGSELDIPVSCVEQGRWYYKSREFDESDNIMSKRARANFNTKISENIEFKRVFYTLDQDEVWDEVDEMENKASIKSETDAMSDVFEAKKGEIEDYLSEIKLEEGQIGIFAAQNGEILGFDIIGRADKFAILYKKLLKSYIMEDILNKEKSEKSITKSDVKKFFEKMKDTKETRMQPPGLGYDYRYKSKDMVGSVLAYKKEVIHSTFFALKGESTKNQKNNDEEDEFYSSFSDRRKNYI